MKLGRHCICPAKNEAGAHAPRRLLPYCWAGAFFFGQVAGFAAQQHGVVLQQCLAIIGQFLEDKLFEAEQQPVAPTVAKAAAARRARIDFITRRTYHNFPFAQAHRNASPDPRRKSI